MKRGRPPKDIERVMLDVAPIDLRIPDSPEFFLAPGWTHRTLREHELGNLREMYPPRVVSIYQAYIDFIEEHGFEPSKPKLKQWALASGYSDLPGPEDLKGWTRAWRDSGLGFLEPYPLPRCDIELLKEIEEAEKAWPEEMGESDFNA
jgi:hypothetical protein